MEIMTKKEYELYKYLKDNNIKDIGSMGILAQAMKVSRSVINRRVISLENKGYIIRNGNYVQLRKE